MTDLKSILARAEVQFANELRKWWSFDDGQRHTHSWHDREDFIKKELPTLLCRLLEAQAGEIEKLRTALESAAEKLEWSEKLHRERGHSWTAHIVGIAANHARAALQQEEL
jgi:hypothetical protein